jgi:hypothetical protein
MRGETQRAEDVVEQRLRVPHERPEEPSPAIVVLAERGHRRLGRALEQDRGSVVERVGDRGGRLDPVEPVLGERQRPKQRRRDPERMDRRADVVDEARQRQLGRAASASDRVGCFEDAHRAAGAGEHDRCRKAVRP